MKKEKTIDLSEEMKAVVEELIIRNSGKCVIRAGELVKLVYPRVSAEYKESSIMPRDYCYNRVNKDPASTKHPRLLEMLGDGMYICLGEDYPYSKPMYTQPTGTKNEIVVGNWENGIFTLNENWEKCGLKKPTFKNVKK